MSLFKSNISNSGLQVQIQSVLIGLVILMHPGCRQVSENGSGTTEMASQEYLLERADSFELDTQYDPPPGDSLSHHASGFAKIMCSGIFITDLEPGFVRDHIGFFTAPEYIRDQLRSVSINHNEQFVLVGLPGGGVRKAVYTGGQGCITLPIDGEKLFFTPRRVLPDLPDPESVPWPMADELSGQEIPGNVDMELVNLAMDSAFHPPEGLTAAFVVTYKGKLLGEKYRENINMYTPLESWSMGKSLTATLMGVLIQQGVYNLWQPAPVPEWQEPGDPRQEIRIADIMRMSSGLRFKAPQDPDYEPGNTYPDHLYVYTGGVNSFKYAASLLPQWPPNTIGRYRNCDPVLINYLIRLGVEGRGEDYLSFPQKALFDKIGIRNMVMETDPYGNFLLQGYEFGTARDWARLGNLYLQDGVWNGERILPEGFVDFVSTVAPAWKADKRPIYGGFFWINGNGAYPIPEDAYYMAGAGNQKTIIIPSHDLVIVRLGHYSGGGPGDEGLKKALELLVKAVE